MLARCVLDVLWIPENIVRAAGRRAALVHARDTVLRGVAARVRSSASRLDGKTRAAGAPRSREAGKPA
jgi:hypothetical protein